MKLSEYKPIFSKALSLLYSETEIRSFFALIMQKHLGLSATDLHTKSELELTKKDLLIFDGIVEQLGKERPIQYILGETEFYDLTFRVNESVLIPRPETEELVHWILEENKNREELKVLDIGTGSGCIAISLAVKLENAEMFCTDKSVEALKITQYNARKNYAKIKAFEHDVLADEFPKQKFDIIVSNPPYVRESEQEEMKKNVLDYEPHLALFVSDNDPLVFYDRIAHLASRSLNKNGVLYLEINQYLAKETEELLHKYFTKVELRKDLNNNYRMLKAEK